jgi:DNA-binding transcriptional LysR family regulator
VNIEELDLRLLRSFETLMSERSVSRAAQRLNLSQPAMSVTLARLRALFGDPLLVRAHGVMVPTPKALALVEALRDVLNRVRALSDVATSFDPRTSRARFRIAAPGYAVYVVAPRLPSAVERLAPSVQVEIRMSNRERAVEWLEKGELDFQIGWLRDPPQGLRFKTLYRDRLVCLARKNHPGIKGKLTLERLCALPHVRAMIHHRSASARVVDEALNAIGRKLRITMVVQDFLVLPHAVAASNHLAIAPARFARWYTQRLPIRAYPLPLRVPEQNIALYWHERSHRSAPHEWFRDVLGSVAKAV